METESTEQILPILQDREEKKHKLLRRTLLIVCVIAVIGIIALAGYMALTVNNEYRLELTLNGEQNIVLEYGSQYEELGAEGTVCGTLLETESQKLTVKQSGTVDTSRVGSYQLRYSISYGRYSRTAVRTVNVVDTQKPSISLVADPSTYTLPGTAYKEEGFVAHDDYDGDLTQQVIREEKDGVVTYTVSDSSGNTTQVTRTIVYDDPVPPEIALQGGTSVSLYVGSPFVDTFTATDNCDGDITDWVTISGSVNSGVPGTYTLTYTVKDSYENEVSVTRTVYIMPKPVPAPPPKPVGGVIYLTFDDGPGAYTQQLLDVLAKYDVKATFFVVNTGRVDMLSKIVAGGHSIGIHSITHNYEQIYASEEAYFNDLYGMQEIIRQHTGVTTYLMRFPGGSSNTVSRFNPGIMTRLTRMVQEKGFKYFDWNVSSGDAGGGYTSEQIYQRVITGCSTKTSSIVLQHDIQKASVDAVEAIIQWGLANGYSFSALSMDSPGCHHGVNN